MQVCWVKRWKGDPGNLSRVSGWTIFSGWLLTINSEADTNWFIRKSTKLDTQWVTDFFTDPRESANIPLWEHAFQHLPDGDNARKGTMRKPLSTFAWPWTCGQASYKPLPACFDRFLLFLFFAKIYVLLIVFLRGSYCKRKTLYFAGCFRELYMNLETSFSRSLPGISVQRLLLFGPRRRGAGCLHFVFLSGDNLGVS